MRSQYSNRLNVGTPLYNPAFPGSLEIRSLYSTESLDRAIKYAKDYLNVHKKGIAYIRVWNFSIHKFETLTSFLYRDNAPIYELKSIVYNSYIQSVTGIQEITL